MFNKDYNNHNNYNHMLRDILMSYGLLYIEISAKDGRKTEYIKGTTEEIEKAFLDFLQVKSKSKSN